MSIKQHFTEAQEVLAAFLADDRENREALQVRASALCEGFPEWVGDGLWPVLPERP